MARDRRVWRTRLDVCLLCPPYQYLSYQLEKQVDGPVAVCAPSFSFAAMVAVALDSGGGLQGGLRAYSIVVTHKWIGQRLNGLWSCVLLVVISLYCTVLYRPCRVVQLTVRCNAIESCQVVTVRLPYRRAERFVSPTTEILVFTCLNNDEHAVLDQRVISRG